MKHDDKVKAIKFIRPDAEFYLNDDELTWLDKTQIEPTEAEIKKGLIAYQAATQAEAEANATAKAAILDRIGLTADELQTILG
jgi:hypothetical protein